MSEGRLPTHVEVSAMIRAAQAAGGFATVVAKGDREAGAILVLTMERGGVASLWERMPRLDGTRAFSLIRNQTTANDQEFEDYVRRRTTRDPDSWLVELDIPDAERFIAEFGR